MQGELCWKRVAAFEDQRWSKDDLARLHGECTISKSLEVWHECGNFLVLLTLKKKKFSKVTDFKIFKWLIWMFLRHCTSQAQLLDSKDQCILRKEKRYVMYYLAMSPNPFDNSIYYISVGEHVYFQIGPDFGHRKLRLTFKPH